MTRFLLQMVIAVMAVGCNTSADAPKQATPVDRLKAMPELNSEVLEEIDVLVRSAFWDCDRIVEIMCEELYAPGDLDENAVSLAIESCIDKWRSGQADWPDVTDCDRLDRAFTKLNELGIVALHNAGMTQSDGYDDFRQIYASHPRKSELVGYCFYHGQDLERVVRGGPLFFCFGPCDAALEESDGGKVGQMIVRQLTDAGLQVEWDGTFAKRMSVIEFNWQRRTAPKTK